MGDWGMGLLPDTQICGCACAGNAGNVFPVTAGKRSRHASRYVRHARAVMHAGIANQRFPLKSAAGENVPGIPGACATCNFMYLVRGPWSQMKWTMNRARFLYLARGKLRLCVANHRTGYFSNLACDWLSIVWAYSEQETENGHRLATWAAFYGNEVTYCAILSNKASSR